MHFDNKQKIRQLIYLIKKDTFSSGIDETDQIRLHTPQQNLQRKGNTITQKSLKNNFYYVDVAAIQLIEFHN